MGNPIAVSKDLSKTAYDHLWMHFTRMSSYENAPVPTIVRGEGTYIYDDKGKRYLDGLVRPVRGQRRPRPPRARRGRVQAGAGARLLPGVVLRPPQGRSSWPSGSPQHAPGDLNKVFFTTGGGEAVETAWKLAKQYFKLKGKPTKYKVISRAVAYHGTPQGALSITGLPALKAPFEPLVPGAHKVPNTNIYRAPIYGDDPEAFGRWAADQIEQQILFEGPETVAAVFLEPVQNAGGCFPPPPGYFQRVREICDQYDVLLVSDEVICAFGRLGTMFACDKFGYVPDMITCAKGMTSGYSPIGACIISDRLAEPFYKGDNTFLHGYTFGGHPVSAAVGLANLDIFEQRGPQPARPGQRGRVPHDAAEAARPADRRRRPRQRLLLRHRAGEGQGHQGDLHRRGDRAGAVRLPLQGAVRRTACTAAPTTAATRSSSSRRR